MAESVYHKDKGQK